MDPMGNWFKRFPPPDASPWSPWCDFTATAPRKFLSISEARNLSVELWLTAKLISMCHWKSDQRENPKIPVNYPSILVWKWIEHDRLSQPQGVGFWGSLLCPICASKCQTEPTKHLPRQRTYMNRYKYHVSVQLQLLQMKPDIHWLPMILKGNVWFNATWCHPISMNLVGLGPTTSERCQSPQMVEL